MYWSKSTSGTDGGVAGEEDGAQGVEARGSGAADETAVCAHLVVNDRGRGEVRLVTVDLDAGAIGDAQLGELRR